MSVVHPRNWFVGVVRVTRIVTAIVLMLSGWSNSARAATSPTEYELKAAYLVNFARFVKWPAQKLSTSDTPFVIGVVGDDSFASAIDSAVHGTKVYEHRVVARRVSGGEELRRCHLLFVSRTGDGRMPALIADLRDQPILTVGESDKFISLGGMINFTTISDTIHFEINRAAAEKTGLKVDSRLLSLAKIADASRIGQDN